MRFAYYLMLVLVLAACGYRPELMPVDRDRYPASLSVSYGKLLLQVTDADVDSTWTLEEDKTSITINGKLYPVVKAIRQEFITGNGGFAYYLWLDAPRFDEGEYRLEATIEKDQAEREYDSRYMLRNEFGSVFHYLYAIYEQRREMKREKRNEFPTITSTRRQ